MPLVQTMSLFSRAILSNVAEQTPLYICPLTILFRREGKSPPGTLSSGRASSVEVWEPLYAANKDDIDFPAVAPGDPDWISSYPPTNLRRTAWSELAGETN